MMAGTVHPKPSSIGINALPDRPIEPIMESIMYATRDMYPLSSRNARHRKSIAILGKNSRIPPTPAIMPSTMRLMSQSAVPI